MRNQYLVDLRRERNLSQKEAAKLIGIASSTLAMLETGERSGRDWVKRRVANFYGKTVDEIFFTNNTHGECVVDSA